MDRLISEKSVMEVIYGCDWFIDEEHVEVIKERIKAIPSADIEQAYMKGREDGVNDFLKNWKIVNR